MPDPFPLISEESTRRVRRIGVRISVFYFVALLAVLTGLAVLDGWETPATFAGRCINHLFAIGITVLLGLAITRFRGGGFALKACIVVALTLVAASIYFFISFYVFRALGMNDTPLTAGSALRMILYWFAQFLGWSALVLALIYHVEVQERERQLSQLREQAYGAQMRALRYQINPHFLFNTLNALAALIEERELSTAERMVLSLSGFLRSTLALDPLQDITLGEELDIQARYLDIERERFSDRLSVTIDVAPDLRRALVPSLILQPLIENAVKHGVGAVDRAVQVRLRAERRGDQLMIEVENDAPQGAAKVDGTGVGLRNVGERLAARFGPAGRLVTNLDANRRFCAAIFLPFREVGR